MHAPPNAGDPVTPPAGFDYELPPERIAQHPASERDAARLLVVPRGSLEPPIDRVVRDLPEILRSGDLLVVNRSRVIPARLRGRRVPEGGAVEILLIARAEGSGADARPRGMGERWRALARPTRRLSVGQRISLGGSSDAGARSEEGSRRGVDSAVEVIVSRRGDGWIELGFAPGVDALAIAERMGEPPLPPYIRRPHGVLAEDAERYQTVYAAEPGSIAAPTAGLHLTAPLLAAIRQRGVEVAEVVLHVGPATFLAGRSGRSELAVEPERYLVPAETHDRIARTRATGGRVIAVGTTTTRALESAARAGWPEGPGETSLVLEPGSTFRAIDGLLTNFHLPRSSLLALVSAFAGREVARRAYVAALDRGYRFYSYGDAMIVL